jgi:hypothetical protein
MAEEAEVPHGQNGGGRFPVEGGDAEDRERKLKQTIHRHQHVY